VPFVRISRDKRGYEHIYLIDASTRGGRPSRARVLYWFRTPAGVKVGREPFDEGVRRALEEQNPHLVFDWKAIVSTPPPPEPEPWRERRRLERLAKQARQAASDEVPAEPAAVPASVPLPEAAAPAPGQAEAPPGAAGTGSGGRRRRRGRRRRGGGQRAGSPGPGEPTAMQETSVPGGPGPADLASQAVEPADPSDRLSDASNQEE
jgi:hypothetical protein